MVLLEAQAHVNKVTHHQVFFFFVSFNMKTSHQRKWAPTNHTGARENLNYACNR